MNIRYFILSVFVIIISYNTAAQEQLQHEMKWYIGKDGKFYTNKHLPVYIRLSHSPEEGAKSHLLKSRSVPQYTNPMYFDTEGYNSFRSPSAVDTVTKRMAIPKRDIRFEVYADGKAPRTTIHFSGAKKYVTKRRKTVYGPSLNISFNATDAMSGVENIYYSINGSKYLQYNNAVPIQEEGNITIKYYSVDNVGNVEEVKQVEFSVDLTPPATTYKVEGEVLNGVVSPNAKIVLSAEDAIAGVKKIMYSLNNGIPQLYTKPINFSSLKGGEVKLKFFAVDNVDNSEDQVNINKREKNNTGNNNKTNEYVMFVDKSGPSCSAKIIGDKYQSKHLYVSGRSKVELNASDDKIEVNKINYSINTINKDKVYNEPFSLTYSRNGFYSINFCATDRFGNVGKLGNMRVYLDNISPISKIKIGKKKFSYNNETIISSKTNISIHSIDLGSEINRIEYSVDGSDFTVGSDFNVNNEGTHTIKYRAVDNVNNEEKSQTMILTVDNQAPEIQAVHSMDTLGRELKNGIYYPVYPTGTTLFLAATDNTSGITNFNYSINGNNEVDYIKNASIAYEKPFIKEGFYSVKVQVSDKLGNKAEKIIEFFTRNNS